MTRIIACFCLVAVLFFVAGCGGLNLTTRQLRSTNSSFLRNVDLDKLFSQTDAPVLTVNATARVHIPENLNIPEEVGNKHFSVEAHYVPLDILLKSVRYQTGVPVVVRNDVPHVLVDIEFNGELVNFFRYISKKYDIWITWEDGTVLVEREKDCFAWVPIFMVAQEGEVKTKNLKVDVKPGDLANLLRREAEKLEVTVVGISDGSGYIHFRGTPEKVKIFGKRILDEVARLRKFVLVKIAVLQLTLNREHAIDFRFDRIWKAATLNHGRIEAVLKSSNSIPQEKRNMFFGITGKDSLQLFFNYLNHYGRLEVLSTPIVMTASGIPAEFSITREVGWWEPGDIVETYGVAGDQTSRLRQDKPTWNSEKVGLTIVVRPKVVNDKQVLLDFFFKDSNVYDITTFNWQAYPGIAPIPLKKPLISERKLLNRTVLAKGQYLLVAGLRTGESDLSKDILGRSKSRTDTYLLLVLQPVF